MTRLICYTLAALLALAALASNGITALFFGFFAVFCAWMPQELANDKKHNEARALTTRRTGRTHVAH
jgi:hypothetical protein